MRGIGLVHPKKSFPSHPVKAVELDFIVIGEAANQIPEEIEGASPGF
jgi:hypothetical protein